MEVMTAPSWMPAQRPTGGRDCGVEDGRRHLHAVARRAAREGAADEVAGDRTPIEAPTPALPPAPMATERAAIRALMVLVFVAVTSTAPPAVTVAPEMRATVRALTTLRAMAPRR